MMISGSIRALPGCEKPAADTAGGISAERGVPSPSPVPTKIPPRFARSYAVPQPWDARPCATVHSSPERHDDAHVGGSSVPERRHHHRFDGVHPVLRLIEYDGVFRLEHLVCHFHSIQPELLENLFSDPRLPVVECGQTV